MPTTTRDLPHPDLAAVELTAVLFALSEPARLIARDGPRTVANCQAVDPAAPKSTFSHHLKALREAGLIRNEPHGRGRMVSLRRDELDGRFPGLLESVL